MSRVELRELQSSLSRVFLSPQNSIFNPAQPQIIKALGVIFSRPSHRQTQTRTPDQTSCPVARRTENASRYRCRRCRGKRNKGPENRTKARSIAASIDREDSLDPAAMRTSHCLHRLRVRLPMPTWRKSIVMIGAATHQVHKDQKHLSFHTQQSGGA